MLCRKKASVWQAGVVLFGWMVIFLLALFGSTCFQVIEGYHFRYFVYIGAGSISSCRMIILSADRRVLVIERQQPAIPKARALP